MTYHPNSGLWDDNIHHLSKSLCLLFTLISMDIRVFFIFYFYSQSSPSALLPQPHYLGNLHHYRGIWTLHSMRGTLFSSQPTTSPCSGHHMPSAHTHTHRHTPTHKTQATPWGLVLRCNFLSIKISFLSCRCHDNAPWRSCSLVKSNEVSRYCCGLPVTPDL